MLICLCRNVSEEEIVEAVKSGTLHDLFERTRFGTDCGTCTTTIRCIVEENDPEHSEPND